MRILHITDIHAGWEKDEHKEQEWWNHICQAIVTAQSETPFDFVAATGDFCKMGSRWEFARAEQYLTQLRFRMGLKAERFFFCPGNHDADTQEPGSSFVYYGEFLKKFYGEAECPAQGTEVSGGGQVFTINTCTTTCWPYFDDATLPAADVDKILELADPKKKTILLMHHQPEILDDQSLIERLGASGKIRLTLSGHLHCYARRYNRKGLNVINGMPLMPHMSFIPTGFQVIDLTDEGEMKTWMCVLDGKGGYQKQEFFC